MKPVASLNSHDVLLGRGNGSNHYIGNQRFRALVEERKEEYISTGKQKPKSRIAKEVLDQIHSLGGRFLRRHEDKESVDSDIQEGTWYVVDEKTALEKCKQALREQRKPPTAAKSLSGTSGICQFLPPATAVPVAPYSYPFGIDSAMSVVPSSAGRAHHALTTNLPAAMDARLLLSRADPSFAFSHFNQALIIPGYMSGLPQARLPTGRLQGLQPDLSFSGNPADTVGEQRFDVQDNINVMDANPQDVVAIGQESSTNDGVAMGVASMPKEDSPVVAADDDVSEFLLSILALSGRTKFTEQEDAQEKANTTNEEKAKVLSDLFGKYCSTHQSKKARRDLDKDSIAFLVKQMRDEIEKIPAHKKQALMEAERVCSAEEFSDVRLERFLRCVGMDVQVRADVFLHPMS
jgi:hypothetical protein